MKPTPHYLLLLPLLVLATPAFAQPAPLAVALSVNGRAIDTDTPALLQEDFLLIAASVLESELGLNVEAADNGLWRVKGYERQLLLRPDNRAYSLDGETLQSPAAPLLRGAELYIPIHMLLRPFGFSVYHNEGWQIATLAAAVQSVRQGSHPDRVRFVVDLTAPALFRWHEEPGKVILEFPATPDPQGRSNLLRVHTFDDALAEQVTETLEGGFTRLVFAHVSPEPPQLFTLKEPARIILDLLRAAPESPVAPKVEAPKPHPGDLWDTRVFNGSRGLVRGFIIRFNPQKTAWKLRPALAASTMNQRSRVSRIVSREGAYGGVNGGYFSLLGPPLGMLVIEGEWVKGPLWNRAVLGISKDGQYAIAQTDWAGRVEFEGFGFLPLETLNEGHGTSDSVAAYTRRWGDTVSGALGRTRLVVNKAGLVTMVLINGEDAAVPESGFIVSGSGTRAETLKKIPQGTRITLHPDTNPNWPGLLNAVGGGPILVAEGKLCVNGKAERFRADITQSCRPRTAVGLAANGDVILLAIQNPGVTLTELANILLKLGARDAMNLDGGGSTTMVVNGKVLNAPSDGSERAVSNALLVVKR